MSTELPTEITEWAPHGEPVKFVARVGDGICLIVRHDGSDENIQQAQFVLRTDGPSAAWDHTQGDLDDDDIPATLWRRIWKAVGVRTRVAV